MGTISLAIDVKRTLARNLSMPNQLVEPLAVIKAESLYQLTLFGLYIKD